MPDPAPDLLSPPLDLQLWLRLDASNALPGGVGGDRLQLALEVATGWVQDYTGQRLLLTTNETVTVPLYGRQKLWLPERPVVSVSSVSTTTTTGITTVRTLGLEYAVFAQKIVWLNPGPTFAFTISATITYTHGYTVAPQGIRGVVLSAASRIIDNPFGHRSESVGGISWSAARNDPGGGGLTPLEQASLNNYRLFPTSSTP